MFASRHLNHTNPTLLAGMLLLALHQGATAAITTSGYVDPIDGGVGTLASTVRIGGRMLDGSLTIDQGSALISKSVVIGSGEAPNAKATVEGTGSFWGVQDWLSVGETGNGELTIADGGIVSVGRSTSVTGNFPAVGTIRFDNGTLITPELFGSLHNLTGTGTIYTNGLIADGVDITVRSSFLPGEPFQLNQSPDQNITVYLSPDERGVLGAGFDGVGSLTISYPHHVDSRYGYIGYHHGSSGTVTVQGKWSILNSLEVGGRGSGILHIGDEAEVEVQEWTTTGWRSNGGSSIEFHGGELKTGTLATDVQELHGTGTIFAQGMVADGYDLVFDSQHGTNQTIRLNEQFGQDVLIHLDVDHHSILGAGYRGAGSLTIRDGVTVDSLTGRISYYGGSSGTVDVSGEGTRWRIHNDLRFGGVGDGVVTIRDSALVMTDSLWTGYHNDDSGATFINMANGGMFAIKGKLYPTSVTLMDFYEYFVLYSDRSPDVFRYWDALSSNWSDLNNATLGVDYSLEYFDTGDLTGYTVLTVHTPIPEPHTAAVLWLGLTAFLHQSRGR